MKVHCIKFHVFFLHRKSALHYTMHVSMLHYSLFLLLKFTILFHFVYFSFFCAGFDEGAHQGGISLFETQVHTPTVKDYDIEDRPVKHAKEPVSKRTRSALSPAKPVKNAPSKRSRRAVSPPNAESSDDDFMAPPPVRKRTRSAAVERPDECQAVILSNKRHVQKPSKYRTPVQKLQPANFSHPVEARKLLQLVLRPTFRIKYSELVPFFFRLLLVCL